MDGDNTKSGGPDDMPTDYLDMGPGGMVHPYLGNFGMPAAEEGMTARVGTRLEEGAEKAPADAVEAALRSVYDPEIPVNIYDLGLIYSCEMDDFGDVAITMTLTAPACPVAGEMPGQVAEAVAGVDGVGEVSVTLTWEPPWRPDMMSEDAKMALDLF